jgi:aerobic carbon-monoxide dehydrogenase large subunit
MGIFSGEFGREIVFLNPGNFQNGAGLRVPRSKSAPQPAASPREALQRRSTGVGRAPSSSTGWPACEGNYIDDLKMPGILFRDFVRSPYSRAEVKSINKAAALALLGVKAVLTADDLKPLKLHWMPTLAGDVQAVLADEKVLFQARRSRSS